MLNSMPWSTTSIGCGIALRSFEPDGPGRLGPGRPSSANGPEVGGCPVAAYDHTWTFPRNTATERKCWSALPWCARRARDFSDVTEPMTLHR